MTTWGATAASRGEAEIAAPATQTWTGMSGHVDKKEFRLAALRTEMRGLTDRTRRLPGTGALVLTAVITAVLTVVLMVAVQRLNLDSLLPPRANAAATR